MKVIDKNGTATTTTTLAEDDPRVKQIRMLLHVNEGDQDPIAKLWNECSDELREVLVAIATPQEVTQQDLENALGADVDGVKLRGRTVGLAKISKRLGIPSPIRSIGTRRDFRRFSLSPDIARQVLKLHTKTQRQRNSP